MRPWPLALALLACRALPEHRIEGRHAVVRADDPTLGRHVLASLESLAPRVRARLGSRRRGPVALHVVPGPFDPATFADRIELDADLAAGPWLERAVAHELVHWYGDDTWVAELPHFVEEGVAEHVALELAGGGIEAVEGRPDWRALLHTRFEEWRGLPRAEARRRYAWAYELVRRVGLERVRELAGADVETWLVELCPEEEASSAGPRYPPSTSKRNTARAARATLSTDR